MRKLHRHLATMASVALSGALLPSCGADLQDALLIGVFDAISGTVTDSIRTVVPLSEWLAQWFGGA